MLFSRVSRINMVVYIKIINRVIFMIRNNYLEDILAGNNSILLEKDSIKKISQFIRTCKRFFEMGLSKHNLKKENLVIIQRLLKAWPAIKQVFLDEVQLISREAIKQYYNCYQFHPYIDCFDLLTRDLSLELSELKFENDSLIIEQNTPIVNKLITFSRRYKAKFLKDAITYERTGEYRYKQAIGYYEQFMKLSTPIVLKKRIYYFTIILAMPKGFLWAQLYHAIQQMYKRFNELFIRHGLLVVRTLTINGNDLEFQFICMGFSYLSYHKFQLYVNQFFLASLEVLLLYLMSLSKYQMITPR